MITNSRDHKLIVFEGIDGVGKTTLSKMLVAHLNGQTPDSAVRFEDLGFINPTRELRRRCEVTNDLTAAFLTYTVSALFKDKQIRRLLVERHVVMDRYVYSALAHHLAYGVDIELLDLDRLPILRPDHAFLLTVEERERRKRLKARGNLTRGDRRKKTRGSKLEAIELCFMRLVPNQIDVTHMSPDQTLQLVLDAMDMREVR